MKTNLIIIIAINCIFSMTAFASNGRKISIMNPIDIVTDPNAKIQVQVSPVPKNAEKSDYSYLKDGSLSIINKAYHKIVDTDEDPTAHLFSNVYYALERATVNFPSDGYDFTYCIEHPRVLGFAYVGAPNAYICSGTLNESSKYIEQVIVHESVHVWGEGDECETTRIELLAMGYSGEGAEFENGYVYDCGLTDLYYWARQ